MNAPHPDNARAGVTCLGSAVALVFAVVLAAALIRVAGWLPLLLIIAVVVLPICRLLRASRRFDPIVRESTSDSETGPGAGQ
jgi:predicted MFS family arabinose efflux permease